MSKPYGDPKARLRSKTVIDPDLKSKDIGSGIRIVSRKKADPIVKELSEYEKQIQKYENKVFVKNRKKNPFWISRSVERMCKDLSLKYDAMRNEFVRVLEHDTAQVITIPTSQTSKVRDVLEAKSTSFEEFLINTALPHSLALHSSLERATQVAQVVSQDPDLTLDDKYIRMSHTDAMSLKAIEFFMGSLNVNQDIQMLYMEQFVMYRFSGQKSASEKTLESIAHSLSKGNIKTDQTLSNLNTVLTKLQKTISNTKE